MQQDDTFKVGTGTRDDPIIITMTSDGIPATTSGTGWTYANNTLTLDNYYYRIVGTCACKISALTYAHIMHGGVFASSISNYISNSDTQVPIIASGCTINDVLSNYAYVVGSETITVTFPSDISGWNITVTSSSYPYSEEEFNLTNSEAGYGWFRFIPDVDSRSLVIKTHSSGVKRIVVTPTLTDKDLIIENGYPYGSNTTQKYQKWEYSPTHGLTLKSGDFEFDSTTVVKCPVSLESGATLNGGTFAETVTNNGTVPQNIKGGIFLKRPVNAQNTLQQESCVINVTLDSADYTVNSLPVDSESKTFYYAAPSNNNNFPIEVKYTGPNDVYSWNTSVGSSTDTIAPGKSVDSLLDCTRSVSSDAKTMTLTVMNTGYTNGPVTLAAVHVPAPTVKATLTNNKTGDVFVLESRGGYDGAPEFPYIAEGYTFATAPVVSLDYINDYQTDIAKNGAIRPGEYKITVTVPADDAHGSGSFDYYFYIVEPTYSVTVEGSGEAWYSYYGTDTALGSTKIEKDTLITLKSTVDPVAEGPFIRWSFDKTDDITFTDEHGTELSADDVDLTQDTIFFKMPTRNVNVTAVTTEPISAGGDSTSSDSGADAIVAGTLLGGTAYLVGTHVWLNSLYGMVPTNRQQLALALWEKAGKPVPASAVLFEDISADSADVQAAALWCTEQGLVKDYGETAFKPDRYVFRVQALKAWYDLQKLNG